MNPFEWFNPGQQPPGPVDPWQATALPPQPPVPQEVPRIGKPIGPDVPEPKWSAAPKPQSGGYLDFVRKREGFNPRAYDDYKQMSIGYGTRARPGETSITREEGERRLGEELENARKLVRGFGAKLSSRQEDALTDLTYNAGGKWMSSGLGAAVKAGDWNRAADLFRQYNKAGGKTLPGLVDRRNAAAGWLLDSSGAPEQITAQEGLPTSTTPSQASQPRSRGMIDAIKGWLGGMTQAPQEQPAPTADSIIANLERLGVTKDDPNRGLYEYMAQSLTGGRKAKPEMSPMMQGFGVFADTLGAGLGRRGGNTAAQPMFMQHLKMNKAEREKADDRGFQAPLKMLEAILPYRMKEIERQRRERMIQGIMGGDQGGGPAPIAPGGANGVQIPNTAPIAPVQRAELPPPGATSPAGGPPAAGLPPQPQMTPGMPQAPGGPPAPQQAMPQAIPGTAPSGPAGSGSKFRVTPEEVEKRFPLPHDPRRITAMSAYDDKMADNMRQQNELALKQRDQFIKMYEVGRATDDPEATKAKEEAKLDAKRAGDIKTAQTDAGRAMQGITNSIKALDEMVTSDKFTEKAIGAFDTSEEGILPWGFGPSGQTLARVVTSGNDVGSDEVRTFIEQRARGIAASMKPFVRKPGEGAWSDKDQLALENMVGDLTKSRDATDLRRRVRNIHSFVNDTFAKPLGIDIGSHGLEDVGGTSNPKGVPGPSKGDKPGAPKSAASEPVGATRTVNGQSYIKTPQGWVPAGGAQPAAPQAAPPQAFPGHVVDGERF